MQPQSNTNDFFGIRISQPGINVQNAQPNQLLYQSDYSTETWYGLSGNEVLQIGNIGTGSTAQYGMSVPASSGTITFGENSDGSLGMEIQNNSSQTTFIMDGQTWTWFDSLGNVVMYVGLLPVLQVYGWAVATPGNTLLGQV